MKKQILCGTLAVCLLAGSALAYQVPNNNTMYDSFLYSDGVNNEPQAQAQMLKGLGLFLGTKNGFELDRSMTRAEAAAMLVRFLGAEETSSSQKWEHPFTDVPDWADGYVGWLYQNHLTKGVSDTKYGASQDITGTQFATFISRALTGKDDYLACGVLTQTEEDNLKASSDAKETAFRRQEAVALSVRALSLQNTQNGTPKTLAQTLVEKGTFTAQQLFDAGWGVLQPKYTTDSTTPIAMQLAGVTVTQSNATALSPDLPMSQADLPYFFGYQVGSNGAVDIFRIDCKTLGMRSVASYPVNAKSVVSNAYAATFGEKAYLLLQYTTDTAQNTPDAMLLVYHNTGMQMLLDAAQIGNGNSLSDGSVFHVQAPKLLDDGSALSFSTYEGEYRIAQDGSMTKLFSAASSPSVSNPSVSSDTAVLAQGNTTFVKKVTTADGTALQCIRGSDNTILDSYPIAASATLTAGKQPYWYGIAGLYRYENDRLTQVYTQPVYDLQFVRWGAGTSDPYLLTGMNTAQALVRLADGKDPITVMTADKLGITGMTFADGYDSNPCILGRNGTDAGVYSYLIADNLENPQKSTVVVVAFTPDDAQQTTDTDAFCRAEQARLEARGLSS